MYKFKEKIFFDAMRPAQNAAAWFSLCTLHSAELVLIDAPVPAIAPMMADFEAHGLEFIHGLNQSAGYRITQPGLNLVHAISRDNAGHFMLDERANTAAFSASHRGLLESAHNHSVDVLLAGTRVLSINSLALFDIADNLNCSFAANHADSTFELALNFAAYNIAITVNGLTGKADALKMDAANAARRFYVDAETTVSRINENLRNGHAGTGNDGRNVTNNFVLNHAIAGIKSPGGVSFLTTATQRHKQPIFYHDGHEGSEDKFVPFVVKTSLPSVFINNKNNIVEAITLRCA